MVSKVCVLHGWLMAEKHLGKSAMESVQLEGENFMDGTSKGNLKLVEDTEGRVPKDAVCAGHVRPEPWRTVK